MKFGLELTLDEQERAKYKGLREVENLSIDQIKEYASSWADMVYKQLGRKYRDYFVEFIVYNQDTQKPLDKLTYKYNGRLWRRKKLVISDC